MNTDHYFGIGTSHEVCEDYALSDIITLSEKEQVIAIAIVCDGCSSSKNSDVGARLLAHRAKQFISILTPKFYEAFFLRNDEKFTHEFEKGFRTWIAGVTRVIANNFLHVDYRFMDSTLLAAFSNGKHVNVFMYGDGTCIVERNNGQVDYYIVEFDQSAPYYLSYTIDKERRESYIKEYGSQNITLSKNILIPKSACDIPAEVKSILYSSQNSNGSFPEDFFRHVWLRFDDVKLVTLVSDGISSYLQIEKDEFSHYGMKGVCIDRIAREIISYKNFTGHFVKRRMNMVKKRHAKENIYHYDDMSVATIHLG